jgi:Domain of unknown function (DUF5004)
MKNNFFRTTLLVGMFVGTLATISSCKKDKEEETVTPAPTPAPTKTELLTGKNWKLVAATINPAIELSPGVFVTDWYAQIQPCEQDDIQLYNTNGTYSIDAKVKCLPTDPATTTGTWIFNSAQTIITTDAGTADATDFTILQLDATTLKGVVALDIGTGVIYTITATYAKQ